MEGVFPIFSLFVLIASEAERTNSSPGGVEGKFAEDSFPPRRPAAAVVVVAEGLEEYVAKRWKLIPSG